MCPVWCAGGRWVCARYDTAKPVTGGALRLEVSTPCFCYVSYCSFSCAGKENVHVCTTLYTLLCVLCNMFHRMLLWIVLLRS